MVTAMTVVPMEVAVEATAAVEARRR